MSLSVPLIFFGIYGNYRTLPNKNHHILPYTFSYMEHDPEFIRIIDADIEDAPMVTESWTTIYTTTLAMQTSTIGKPSSTKLQSSITTVKSSPRVTRHWERGDYFIIYNYNANFIE